MELTETGTSAERTKVVEFKSRLYFWSLIIVVGLFFTENFLTFVVTGSLLLLIPVVFLGAILIFAFAKKKSVKLLIGIWVSLLVIGGAFGWLGLIISPDPMPPEEIGYFSLMLLIGSAFAIYFDRNVVVVGQHRQEK